MYIYTYTHVHVFIYTSTCIHMYIYTHMHIYIYTYTYTQVLNRSAAETAACKSAAHLWCVLALGKDCRLTPLLFRLIFPTGPACAAEPKDLRKSTATWDPFSCCIRAFEESVTYNRFAKICKDSQRNFDLCFSTNLCRS